MVIFTHLLGVIGEMKMLALPEYILYLQQLCGTDGINLKPAKPCKRAGPSSSRPQRAASSCHREPGGEVRGDPKQVGKLLGFLKEGATLEAQILLKQLRNQGDETCRWETGNHQENLKFFQHQISTFQADHAKARCQGRQISIDEKTQFGSFYVYPHQPTDTTRRLRIYMEYQVAVDINTFYQARKDMDAQTHLDGSLATVRQIDQLNAFDYTNESVYSYRGEMVRLTHHFRTFVHPQGYILELIDTQQVDGNIPASEQLKIITRRLIFPSADKNSTSVVLVEDVTKREVLSHWLLTSFLRRGLPHMIDQIQERSQEYADWHRAPFKEVAHIHRVFTAKLRQGFAKYGLRNPPWDLKVPMFSSSSSGEPCTVAASYVHAPAVPSVVHRETSKPDVSTRPSQKPKKKKSKNKSPPKIPPGLRPGEGNSIPLTATTDEEGTQSPVMLSRLSDSPTLSKKFKTPGRSLKW